MTIRPTSLKNLSYLLAVFGKVKWVISHIMADDSRGNLNEVFLLFFTC